MNKDEKNNPPDKKQTREKIRAGIITGAKIIREGKNLAVQGAKYSWQGYEHLADWVADKIFIYRD